MTVVVSDTTVLNYLILIQAIDVLPQLFGEVVVPTAVFDELLDARAPHAVRSWAKKPPRWIEIRSPTRENLALSLHSGERAAIALALEIHADRLLIDDWAGRVAAQELGLQVVGTLGVLDVAAAKGFIDLPTVVEKLRSTTFRVDQCLIDSLLARNATRRGERE